MSDLIIFILHVIFDKLTFYMPKIQLVYILTISSAVRGVVTSENTCLGLETLAYKYSICI